MKTRGLTARFWEWINGSWVKISLKPNESIRHYQGSNDEEGYSAEFNSWTNEGHRVVSASRFEGRDCDGRMSRTVVSSCSPDRLQHLRAYQCEKFENHHRGLPIMRPKWERESSRQFDQYAEAAGY
jgi:hypothetical protein